MYGTFTPDFVPFLASSSPPLQHPIRARRPHRISPSTIQTPIARRDRDSLADIAPVGPFTPRPSSTPGAASRSHHLALPS